METPEKLLLRSSPVEDMTPEMGLTVGRALAMDHRKVVISRDMMRSSTMMKEALVAGLTSSGVDVVDLGRTSVPVTAMKASLGDCAVYIGEYREYGMISGYLLMNPNGSLFRKDQLRHLSKVFSDPAPLPDYRHLGAVREYDFATEEYNIKMKGIMCKDAACSVVLDCNGGVCADSAPQIINSMGADVISLNAHKDRDFISRSLTPTESELRDFRQFIEKDLGTIGMILNRAGTIVTVLDEAGAVIDDDVVLAMMMMFLKPGKAVVPDDVTSLVEDAFWGRLGVEVDTPFKALPDEEREFIRSVPDAGAVCDMMASSGAELGYYDRGFIFSDISLMSDGIHAAAVMAQMATGNSLKQISEALPSYYRDDITVHIECSAGSFIRMMNEAVKDLRDASVVYDGGWRIQMKGGWAYVSFDRDDDALLDIVAESRDRAYLIGLMEVAEDLVEECSLGQ